MRYSIRANEIDGKVMIPIRLIVTTSKDVKRAIVEGNKQSDARWTRTSSLLLTEFAEDLEDYFQHVHGATKSVYYERRGRQYDKF